MFAEVAQSQLPDLRLKKRLHQMVDHFSGAPEQSIPQVMGKRDFKATYEFLNNKRVTHAAILAGQRQVSIERIADSCTDGKVLVVQDTTSFDFSHHPATTGLGALDNVYADGFLAHSSLAVSSSGVPLGLLDQQVWIRPLDEIGKKHKRHQRDFADKESFKWVVGLLEILNPLDQQGIEIINVCDREAHIYEFVDEVLNRDQQVIVRASQRRGFTETGQDVFETVGAFPIQATYELELQRHPDREAREATVELRFGQVTLRRPKRAKSERETLSLHVVEVKEIDVPPGEKAVHWLLLTTLPVDTFEQAQQIVQWYSYRWLIERFHYVLKSGCRLEDRQLRTQQRLERLLAVFNQVAWRLLWMTYLARIDPDHDCLVALDIDEWQALYATIHQTTDIPPTPVSLYEAVRWIAQLGGFLGRKADGEPGVKVLWRGWTRLQDIVDTWRLFHPPPRDNGNV